MKKILISLICLLVAFVGRAQFNITQNLGSPNTLVKNPNYGGLQGGLIPFTFEDTTAANLTNLKYYAGAYIYTTSPRATWWRDAAVSTWVQVLPGGGSGSLSAWTTTLNTTIPTDLSLNGYLGTTAANGIGFYTSNTQRVILPAGGLTFNQLVSDTTANKVMTYNTSTKEWGYGYWFGGSGATPTWQQTLTAGSTLTGANTITAASYQQTYEWNTLASGIGMYLSSNSTAAVSGQTLLSVATQGANAGAGRTTYGLSVVNTHTGSSSTNYAGYFSASGGSNNYALNTVSGDVRLNQSSGTTYIGNVGANATINLNGGTSGTITIQPQAAAGTFNFNLPTTAGTSGYLLTSAGGGASAMTWTDPTSLSTSLTSTYIGYGSAGNAVTGDANLTYTAASSAVALDSGYLSFTGHKAYGSAVNGSIFRSSLYGLTTRAVTGSSYDWLLFSAGGNTILANPTGTDNFLTSGKFGFGSLGLTPTAWAHVAASTTGVASIRIGDGVAPSSPNAGDIWKVTDKLYFVINTGTATKEFTLNDIALTSGRVPYNTTNGRLTDVSTFTFGSGLLSVPQIKGSGSTPAIAGGAGAGTSPTVSITGTDLAGEITVTTDTDPTTGAVFCTVTFATAFSSAPYVVFSPSNLNAADLFASSGDFFINSTTTTFTLNTSSGVPPANATEYKFHYHVIQ